MALTLAFSPCPNDTFLFDALVHGRVGQEGFFSEPYLEDVETLNRWAFEGRCDVTKLSYHAAALLTDTYQLLRSGSALGRGCGPLLIAREPLDLSRAADWKIAIPGRYTTAAFLLKLAVPQAAELRETLFYDIENAVLTGEVDAGVIIHENRFTYAQKGLVQLIDLGAWWEEQTGWAIPLGGIAIRRSLPEEVKKTVAQYLHESVAHAFAHPADSRAYVCAHAQEMDETVMRQHIELYVNEYSLELGPVGEAAVRGLFGKAHTLGLCSAPVEPLLV